MSAEWREAPDAEFAVIGDPVAHSLSPRMHCAAYEALSLPWRYVALRVPLGETAAALDHLALRGYRGVNVTLPLKGEALAWAAEAEPFAVRVGAANTLDLQARTARNTDAPGFLETLGPLDPDLGRPVLLLGAGGAARAVAAALSDAGFTLKIWNRTPDRAASMVRDLELSGEATEEPDPTGCQLIVNATAAGHFEASPPVRWSLASPDAVAYDLVYGPPAERFLHLPRANGLRTVDGRGMLVAQGAIAFEGWLGIPAPRGAMLKVVS